MSRTSAFLCSAMMSAVVISLVSCSSDASGGGSSTAPVTYTTGVFGHTDAAACDTDRAVLETAVESYLALNGGSAVTEAQLVEQGLIRQESALHDLGPSGTVIPAPSGGCVR